jgi:hypothetical protein
MDSTITVKAEIARLLFIRNVWYSKSISNVARHSQFTNQWVGGFVATLETDGGLAFIRLNNVRQKVLRHRSTEHPVTSCGVIDALVPAITH